MSSKTSSSVAVKPANILEIALDEESLSTFVKAVRASSELAHILAGEAGPYTVFAPNDNAFSRYGNRALNELLSDPEDLTDLLTFHMVRGKLFSTDLGEQKTLPSLLGKELNIEVSGENISVEEGKIIQADMECGNGVMHIIDLVLVP